MKHTRRNKKRETSNTGTRKNKNKIVYSEKEYNSGDGMLTTVWGPSIWHFLHIMSFNYPTNPTPDEKKHYRDFILNLQNVLPCNICRMNLKTNFKQLPLEMKNMENRETFSRYIYNLHELVNKMLHKESNLKYCDVRDRYEHFRSRCTDENLKKFKLKKVNNKTLKKKEKGCTESLYGKKSKCIIKIVPQDSKNNTFQMDKKCIKFKPKN